MAGAINDALVQQFREWVLTQTSPKYNLFVNKKDENVIVLETKYCRGEVTFFPMDIIQLSVLNLETNHHDFYLHFQMHTLGHAMKLFEEMMETVQELTVESPTRILLCCTSGLTTGFFAEKLNESAKLSSLNYEFSAVSYGKLYHAACEYDIILLAPQIFYIYETAQKILPDKRIYKIPPKVFATYDVRAVFSDLEPLLHPSTAANKSYVRQLPLKQQIKAHGKILAIALIPEEQHFFFTSRIYNDHNDVIYDEVSIKPRICLEDIYDLCDMAFAIYPDIQITGLSMPGIVDDGRITLLTQGFDESNVLESLSKKYSRKFVLSNDANCIAVGYYASQDEYKSLSFLFKPHISSKGGVGSIHNGQLIEGYKHVAGEIQYMPMNIDDSHYPMWMTPEETLSWVARISSSIISLLGPDLILLFCRLIAHTDDVIQEIGKYIPARYLPEVVQIDSVKDYMLFGQMVLCTEELE